MVDSPYHAKDTPGLATTVAPQASTKITDHPKIFADCILGYIGDPWFEALPTASPTSKTAP